MANSCKKCDPHEICEECPEWIFTLADLIMCMMGLFVLLWVLKPSGTPASEQKNDPDTIVAVAEIREAFGYEPNTANPDAIDMEIMTRDIRRSKRQGHGEGGKITNDTQQQEGADPETTSIRQGKQSAVGGRLLFDKGSAELSNDVQVALQQISSQIRGHRNIVLVKGHTSLDDLPDDASPETRMGMSVRRAQVVADFLTSHGVEPDIIRVQGCSTFEPVVQREYRVDSQAQNRRVEVEATSTLVSERQDNRVAPLPTAPAPTAEPAHPKH